MQHYAVDIDALLARANKREILQTCAESPLPTCSSDDVHELFKRVRGRQIDVATDAQMTVLLQSSFSMSDFAADVIGDSVSSDTTSVALHRLKLAAASHNAEKAAKYTELKDKKDSSEYEEWFLRYRPTDNVKTNKVNKTSKVLNKRKGKTRKHKKKKRGLFF